MFPQMVEPVDLQDALVAKLRAIPELVLELDGDPAHIQPYYDIYPANTSLTAALYKMGAPALIVVWQGVIPAPFGSQSLWHHQCTLWVRAGGNVDDPRRSLGRIMQAIYTRPVGETGQPLIHQENESWVPGFYIEGPDLFPFQRQQNEEGIDLWEMPMLFRQLK